jgi:RHS repeat-associated protein
MRLSARAPAFDFGQPGRAAAAGSDIAASGTASGAAPMVMALAEQLGTSTAIDPFTPDKSAHLFAMSDGAQIAIYFDGTDTVFRTRVGSWSAPTTLPLCCNQHHDQSAWTRNGDALYGLTSGSTAGTAIAWKLAYSGGVITLSGNQVWCCNGPGRVFGAYWDATNQLMHVYYQMGSQYVLNAINTSLTQVYFDNGAAGSAAATGAIAGEGTNVFYYGYTTGTGVTVVKVTASATAYTERTEVGTPQLSVDGRGGAMVWDGTELLYVINDGDAKLRLLRRHGQDAYRLYDLVATTLAPGAQPAIARKGSTGDLVLLYTDLAGQANGEIRYVSRTSGVWNAPLTLAGGSATGWGNVAVTDDTNSPGTFPVVYRTGTQSPYGVVDDQLVAPSAPPTTYTISGALSVSLGAIIPGVPVSAYAGGSAGCCQLVATALTNAVGSYSLIVPPGTYRVFADTSTTDNDFASAWYGGSSFATASDVVVASGVGNINVAAPTAQQLSTATGSDPAAPDPSVHYFVMSDGARLVIYFDGTDTVYRIKVNGVWSAPMTLAQCCNRHHDQSAWTRNGDTVYGITAGSTSDVATVWKLVYSAGAVTLSGNTVWCCNAPGRVFGAYWDATNQLMHVYYQAGSTYVLNAINTSLAQVYFANGIAGSASPTLGIAGDGTNVFYYGYVTGAALSLVQVTASATAYTFRTELGTPTLATAATGGSLYWDGSTMLYLANEGDAKIRVTSRLAQDAYTSWADVVGAPLCAATRPAVVRKAGTPDFDLFYCNATAQSSGELYYLRRVAGTWDPSPGTLLAGGAGGWAGASAALDDTNGAGRAHLVYRSGTAAPYGVVEDVLASANDFAAAYAYTFGGLNLASGAYFTSADDLAMPGRLLAFSFTRSYNSGDGRVGPLGPGWTHSYDWAITEDPSAAHLRRGDGRRDDFTPSGGGTYIAPPNVYDVLVKNGDNSYTLTTTSQVQFEFTSAGVLTRIHELAGNQIQLGYTGGLLTTITDTVGRVVALSYTGTLLTQIADPLGRKVTYAYDSSGRLVTVVDKIGNTAGQDPNLHKWQYAYDGTTRHISTITNPDARVIVRNTYDVQGRLTAARDGLDNQVTYSYVPGQTTVTDARQHQTTVTFDARLRQLTQTDVVNGSSRVLRYGYDPQGNRTSVVDRDGNETDFTYDPSGNVLTKTDPQINQQTPRYVSHFTYDSLNNLTVILDPRGFTTTNAYDPTTNVLLSTTAQIDQTTSAVTKYEYGDATNPGLPTKIIGPRGNTTGIPNYTYSQSLTYDAHASLVTRIDADSAKTTYGYDTVGRQTSLIDPDGYAVGGVPSEHTWLTGYDQNDRVTSQTDPLSHSTTTGYDGSGDQIALTDRDGNVTSYTYDNAVRLKTVVQKPDPINQPNLTYTTAILRDPNGNATKVTQANNVVTDYTFDELNRMLSTITHLTVGTSLTTSYVLNGNGQPTTKTTGDGVAITYGYDTMARLTSVAAAGLSTITYGYDELSQRTAMTDATGNTTYQYDGLGRLTQAAQPNGTTTYGYDLDSNRTTLGYPTVGNVTSVYSPGGRLNTVTDWATHAATYQYTAAGLASSVSVPGGMTTTYSYDKAHRLTQLVNAVGANTVSSDAYTLDNEGNRIALDEFVSGITTPPVQSFPSVKVNSDAGTTVQDHPAIALGPDAASYLVWDDARLGNADIEFARRDPTTGTWSANVKVNTDTGTRIQQNPAVALDSSNNAYAVWQDEVNGVGKADIYYSKRSAASGTWLAADVKVSDDPGSGGGGVQRNPRIAGTAAGAETAVWVDLRSSQNNIYSSTLASGGSTWAANKKVTDNTAALKDNPDVIVGADGTSYAVWQDSRNGNADIYFSKLTQGGSAWSANVKVSDDPGTAAQTAPRIGIDSAGNLTVIWLDARTSPAQLRVSRQTAGSNTWSTSTQLTDAAARPSGTPALSERPDGSAWVAWTDTRLANTDIWGSQYTGGSWTTSTKQSDDPGAFAQSNPTLAYSTAELARAWRDDRAGNADIRASRIAYSTGIDHFGYNYDGLERLTGATTTNPESFVLDADSNIKTRTGPVATYTYDTSDRLTNDGTQTFTWNTADRLTNRGPDTFSYDPLDRMTSSTVAATARTYAYNGDGLLKSRTQGTTSQFLWDPSSSPSRLLVQGGDRLVYGLGPLWVVKGDGTTSSFARDGGKSVRAEVNGSGTVTASFRYRAYGAIAQSNGASTPSYLGYAGQLQDPSGLLYMRARWYDPNVGRFTTHDATGGLLAHPSSLNSYGYATSNPMLLLDPTGLMAMFDDGDVCSDAACAAYSPPAQADVSACQVIAVACNAAYGLLELVSTPIYAIYYGSQRTDSSLRATEGALPGPLGAIASGVLAPVHLGLAGGQVTGLAADVAIDTVKMNIGREAQPNDEGFNGHWGPFGLGGVTYLPGWHVDDSRNVDFSWWHPYPWSSGFDPIPAGSRP